MQAFVKSIPITMTDLTDTFTAADAKAMTNPVMATPDAADLKQYSGTIAFIKKTAIAGYHEAEFCGLHCYTRERLCRDGFVLTQLIDKQGTRHTRISWR